jgi:hypothetical protein
MSNNPARRGTRHHQILSLMWNGATRKQICRAIGRVSFNLCELCRRFGLRIVSHKSGADTTYSIHRRRA